MNRHAIAFGLLLVASGMLRGVAIAGQSKVPQPVQVIPPPIAVSAGGEPDELPPPSLEVLSSAESVDLPAVPDLDRGPQHARAVSGAPVVARLPLKPVSDRARNLSLEALDACHTALAARRYEAAIAACRAAITAWDGNHLGWYSWANAHAAKGEWSEARAAAAHAVMLRPERAMYQLLYGIALYHEDARRAREDRSAPKASGPQQVTLDAARAALERAIAIEPRLWRAHYYLGRIESEMQAVRAAAEQFTAAIQTNPRDPSSYVALTELYRVHGEVERALAIATLGTDHVPPADAVSVWSQLAMAHEASGDGPGAIRAMDRALAIRRDDPRLKLERARLFYQGRDLAAATRDIEDAARSANPTMAAVKRRAEELLAQLASYRRSCSAWRKCYPVDISSVDWLGEAWTPIEP